MKLCATEGCGRRHHARGMCQRCYSRWYDVSMRGCARGYGVNPRGRGCGEAPAAPLLALFPGWSGNELGRLFGVTRRTIVRWRAGGWVADADRYATRAGRHPSEIWGDL